MGKARTGNLTSKPLPKTAVLDAGALIAFERGNRPLRALIEEARATGARLVIPAGVLAQVWRDPAKQVALGSLIKDNSTTVVSLDEALAKASGILCGRRQTADAIDASLVLTARREGPRTVVITSDVDDLRHLDASLELHRI